MIFCTHQELFRLRPAWRDPKLPDCWGNLVIDPDTETSTVRVAECDVCGLSIGIPPRQWQTWLDRERNRR